MIEIQGETDFLTRILTKHGAPEQQRTVLSLRLAEANDETVGRAVRRMVWLVGAVLLVYWAGSAVAFSIPSVVLSLTEKILSVVFIAAATSLLAFSMYRFRIRQHLRREIEKCREMIETALDLGVDFNAALLIQQQEAPLLYCSHCRRDLLGTARKAIDDRLPPLQLEDLVRKMRDSVHLTAASKSGM